MKTSVTPFFSEGRIVACGIGLVDAGLEVHLLRQAEPVSAVLMMAPRHELPR